MMRTILCTEGEIIPGGGGQYFVLRLKSFQKDEDNNLYWG